MSQMRTPSAGCANRTTTSRGRIFRMGNLLLVTCYWLLAGRLTPITVRFACINRSELLASNKQPVTSNPPSERVDEIQNLADESTLGRGADRALRVLLQTQIVKL